MRNFLKFGLLLSIVVGFSACVDLNDVSDIEVVGGDREYAFPVINTKVNLQDIIDGQGENSDTELEIGDNGEMTFVYYGDFIKEVSEDLLGTVPGNLPLPLQDSVTALTLPVQFDYTVNKALVKGDLVSFVFTSPFTEDLDLKITLPQMTKDGEPFTVDYEVDYTFISPVPITIQDIPLAGYLFQPEGDTLYIHYEATKKSNGERVLLDNGVMFFTEISFSYVEGNWAREVFELARDTIDINIYNNWVNGDLYFKNPKVIVTLENSFGLPVRSQVNYLGIFSIDNEEIEIMGPAIDDGFDFAFPLLSEVGSSKETTFVFDNSNCNIEEVFNSQPVKVDYDIDAIVNADSDPSYIGFITDSSFFSINVRVELPVWGSANKFSATQLLDFDFNESVATIEDAEFKLITRNGMPIELATQLYFLDGQGQILDSLMIEPLQVPAGSTNSEGDVIQSTEKITFIPVPSSLLSVLPDAKQVLIDASFSTEDPNNKFVKVLSDQDLEVLLGLKLNLL